MKNIIITTSVLLIDHINLAFVAVNPQQAITEILNPRLLREPAVVCLN